MRTDVRPGAGHPMSADMRPTQGLRSTRILYAAAVFLGGFLLFVVQPLLARAILPTFGGAGGVWATALCFYQALLLAGYAYAHLTSSLSTKHRAALHLAIIAASLLWFPILPDGGTSADPASSPALSILVFLGGAVAGPYIVLASTSPLLQSWMVREEPGRVPYRFYALSNAGSLAGLFAYPLLVEPWLDMQRQALVWTMGYGIYLIVMSALAIRSARLAEVAPGARDIREENVAVGAHPGAAGQRVMWFFLPMSGAALLVAITNQLTVDIAAVPFLWILPLSIYLLSYILAFGGWYRRTIYGSLLGIALAGMAVVAAGGAVVSIVVQIAASLIALFAATMVCHGELVMRAPAAAQPQSAAKGGSASSDVTRFYLISAAGGAAGGAFVALLAPLLFNAFWELPLFLVLPYVVYLASIYAAVHRRMTVRQRTLWWAGISGVVILATITFVVPIIQRGKLTVATVRNFYGVLRVIEENEPPDPPQRKLLHGRILHGTQLLSPGSQSVATTYYTAGSGVARAMALHPARAERALRIGVIGLGVGTIAAVAEPRDTIRFYELDPAVEELARSYFSFLDLAVTEVVIGDGRLVLQGDLSEDPDRGFDLLIVDAFSSDAVPVHLLTREAARLYASALRPRGAVVLNITNRHLDLSPVVRAMGQAASFGGVRFHDRSGGSEASPSHWYILTADESYLSDLAALPGAVLDAAGAAGIEWTDGYSNLLRVLR